MPGICDSGPVDLHQQLLRRLGPLAPRLGHHAAEAAGRKRDLKDARPLSGNDSIDVVDLLGEQLRLIERGVRPTPGRIEKTTPWSSAGASSRCENM